MSPQFTQQILLGNQLWTFLFTKTHTANTESVFMIRVLNNEVIRPFCMYMIDDRYEIMNENVPVEIRNVQFQLNQAIANYHTMQSLLNMPSVLNEPNR